MTTGRGSVECSECSSLRAARRPRPCAFSSSTTARRTVQTLIGSNVALSTSTRPWSRPRRRCSASGADGGKPGGGGIAAAWRARVSATRPSPSARAGSYRARAAPGSARAVPRPPPRSCASAVAPVEVGEEQVVAQPPAPRPRLDLRQVDRARRQLGQAAHEPARALVAVAREHDRGLAPAGRAPNGSAVASARQPDEARLVARLVLDRPRAAPRRRRAAAASRGADRRPRLDRSAHDRAHGLGGRARRDQPRAAAARSRRNRAHWPSACGCESTVSIASSADAGARDQALGTARHRLADDRDARAVGRQRVERRVDRALERVLDRHQRRARPRPPAPPSRRRGASAARSPRSAGARGRAAPPR